MPTFGSLFAGIGGFDAGLERAGWSCAFQVELDPFCQRVLAARWPGVERAEDVRTWQPRGGGGRGSDESVAREGRAGGDGRERGAGLFAAGREDAVGGIDLLVGGFPCQDLSVAGKRAGLGGERSGLFWEIVRIAKATRPTWGLFENVPGLVSSHRGSDMALVIAGLRECWPVVGWRILDSRYFGVAQRRRRVFFVCGPTEAGVAQVLALTEGGAGDLEAGGEAGSEAARSARIGVDLARALGGIGGGQDYGANKGTLVAHALSAGAGGSKFGSGRAGQDDFVIADPISANEGRTYTHEGKTGMRTHNVVAFTERTRKDGRNVEAQEDQVRAWMDDGASPCEEVGAQGPLRQVWEGECLRRASQEWRLAGQLAGELGAYLSRLSSPRALGRAQSQSSVRRLTPLEAERLQGFPDGWTCLCQPLEAYVADPDAAALACRCPDSPRYRALGNAVTVNVIEWLGRRLMTTLEPR